MPQTKKSTHASADAGEGEPSVARSSYPVRFAALRGHLTSAEVRVGEYFLAHPESALLSITEVVERAELGYGTIMRFCRKLGCRGFQDFKVLLGRELATKDLPVTSHQPADIMRHVQKLQGEIVSTAELLDPAVVDQAARALNKARQVLVSGVAGSASLAEGFNYRLMRIGVPTLAVCDGYVMALRASLLNKGDVFFAISFSGATKDTLGAAQIAKARGATVVALTNFVNSPLARAADHTLYSATDRDPLACEVFSNVAGSFVLDVVFSRLFNTRNSAREVVEQTYEAVSDRRL